MGKTAQSVGLALLCALAAMGQTISFQPPSSSAVGQGPLAAATGDFNGDGKTDLVIANSATQSISVLLGKGDGTFQPARNYSLPSYCAPNYLAVGDFKKDGKPDLLVLCLLGDVIIVLPGVGDGTFGPPVITQLPLQTISGNIPGGPLAPAAIADFNGDGNLDLVLPLRDPADNTETGLAAYWLEGIGDGTFKLAAQPVNVTSPLAVVAADFNGDHKPDLAILTVDGAAQTASMVIARGLGDGTFRVANSYPVSVAYDITVGDVNGDGIPDVVLSGTTDLFGTGTSPGLAVYIGKGDGTFAVGQNLSSTLGSGIVFSLFLADFAGTGRQDLLAAVWAERGASDVTGSLVAFPAKGDGTFLSPVTVASLGGAIPFAFTAADFNGDGRMDLAFSTMSLAGTNIDFSGVTTPAGAAQEAELFPAGALGIALNAGSGAEVHGVGVSGGGANIAQNAWIEIYGAGLAPASVGAGLTWSKAPDFASGKMPTQLQGVSVTVNGKPAYIFFVSSTQVNVLTPLDSTTGPVSVTVNNGSSTSAPFTVNLQAAAPGFLRYGDVTHIAALHANFSYLGPASMSVPGYAFTPATPGEIILLFGDGFGLPVSTLTAGSDIQTGPLPTPWPQVTIGGTPATVQFAGLISPGLYQINVVVPLTAANGDNQVIATSAGASSPTGAMIPVSH